MKSFLKKNKKIIAELSASFLLLTTVIMPYSVFAAPLIPCGTKTTAPCTFADLVKLFNNVMNFLLVTVLIPAATLAIVFVGIQYLTAMGNPGKLAKAHDTLKDVLIGIFIAIAAYAIIETIFIVLSKFGGIPSITG